MHGDHWGGEEERAVQCEWRANRPLTEGGVHDGVDGLLREECLRGKKRGRTIWFGSSAGNVIVYFVHSMALLFALDIWIQDATLPQITMAG